MSETEQKYGYFQEGQDKNDIEEEAPLTLAELEEQHQTLVKNLEEETHMMEADNTRSREYANSIMKRLRYFERQIQDLKNAERKSQ